MLVRPLLAGLLLLALAPPLARPALAQAPITIVVNFGTGGSADRMARLIGPELAEALGTPVVVKNSTGAAGAIGAAEVARARPDGTTLLLTTTGPMAIQPFFRERPALQAGGFRPGLHAGRRARGDDVGAQQPGPHGGRPGRPGARGPVNYGSAGPGSLPHIVMAALAQQARVEMTHIPFRGSAEAIIALLRDDVSIYADLPGALKVNHLQAVGVMAERRTAEFPDGADAAGTGLRPGLFDLGRAVRPGRHAGGVPGQGRGGLRQRRCGCRRWSRASSGSPRRSPSAASAISAAFLDGEYAKFRAVVQAAGLKPGD